MMDAGQVWFVGFVKDMHSSGRGADAAVFAETYVTTMADEAADYRQSWREDYGTASEAEEVGYKIEHKKFENLALAQAYCESIGLEC